MWYVWSAACWKHSISQYMQDLCHASCPMHLHNPYMLCSHTIRMHKLVVVGPETFIIDTWLSTVFDSVWHTSTSIGTWWFIQMNNGNTSINGGLIVFSDKCDVLERRSACCPNCVISPLMRTACRPLCWKHGSYLNMLCIYHAQPHVDRCIGYMASVHRCMIWIQLTFGALPIHSYLPPNRISVRNLNTIDMVTTIPLP